MTIDSDEYLEGMGNALNGEDFKNPYIASDYSDNQYKDYAEGFREGLGTK